MDGSKCVVAALLSLLFWLDLSLAFDTVLDKIRLDGHDSHDIDIYVEKKLSYLHVKIDLKPAITGLLTLNKFASQLEKNAGSDSLDSVLSKNIRARVNRISKKLWRITGKNYMSNKDKRSIEIIGNLISDLFGNPGPSDWKKVNANLLALGEALKRVNENAGMEHEDIDTNRHSIEGHNAELKALSIVANRNQNELSNINLELSGMKSFMEVSTLADVLDNLVSSLIEVKNDGLKGYCNDRALDKDFLVDNLQALESNKAGLAPIFGSWEWRDYYKNVMCTLALVDDSVWLSLRIPMVKKSEKLVRVIPNPQLRRGLSKMEEYGITPILFREMSNDKFLVITQSALDLCNSLGNTRTCGVRDMRFMIGDITALAVEMALNKFLMVSIGEGSVKVMEKCVNSINEHVITFDSVIAIPNNCSYVSKALSIDVRESDSSITKEIGLIDVSKFSVTKIGSYHANVTKLMIEEIANKSNDVSFKNNRKLIEDKLKSIDTKHDSLWENYAMDKWYIIGSVISIFAVVIIVKMMMCYKFKRMQSSGTIELIEMQNQLNMKLEAVKTESALLIQSQIKANNATNVRTDESQRNVCGGVDNVFNESQKNVCDSVDNVYNEIRSNVNFSAPSDRSQFRK